MGDSAIDGGTNGPETAPRRAGGRGLAGALGAVLAAGLGEAAARPGKGRRGDDDKGKDDRDRDDRQRQGDDDDGDDGDGSQSLIERLQDLAVRRLERLREEAEAKADRLREDAEEKADRLREEAGIDPDAADGEDEEDGVVVERGADGSATVETDNVSYSEGPDGISVQTDNISFGGAAQTDGDAGGGTGGDGGAGGDDGNDGGDDPGFQS